ncbi:MAG TPA: ATPase, T2SS/T4P/T4SS family [Bacilli bacterium]|nr:ATPase, T2SS/T4P/T4SS family [Bacilli bacterium]
MEKLVNVINASFLKDYVNDKNITDISYNGHELFIFDTVKGRRFARTVTTEEVMVLLRNVANLANAQFSYRDTFLDLSIGKYRLSAMHPAKSRYNEKKAPSFALRINHDFLSTNPHYIDREITEILEELLMTNKTIIISGKTGVGKTTLQKYLLTKLKSATRLVVIDNVLELGEVKKLNKALDVTLWQTSETDEEEIGQYVKNALRFHPDYIIIAESRGTEMNEVYQSVITGHPNIITFHARSIAACYARLERLIKNATLEEIYEAFPIIIHLDKTETNKRIVRFIQEITLYNETTKKFETLFVER